MKALDTVASSINNDLGNEEVPPIFLSVLNGSFMFTADLMKRLNFNCELSFIKVSSYIGLSSGEKVNELIGLDKSLEGRSVVIVEDIVDRGITLEHLIELIKEHNPKQIKVASMLFKPDSYEKDLVIDYIGMSVPSDFIIGYGLDFDGLGRQFPDIYSLVQE